MSQKDESFLVTGAAGFVGSCLVRRLLEQQDTVAIIAKPESDLWRIEDIKKRLKIYRGNLTDQKFLKNLVKKVKPRSFIIWPPTALIPAKIMPSKSSPLIF